MDQIDYNLIVELQKDSRRSNRQLARLLGISEATVRRRIKDLAPGGGYVCATVHCIQPDVPPENVCAMFDEALVAGQYPLSD